MAAGPETMSTYATDLMLEMKGPLVENYAKYSVLLSELKRKGGDFRQDAHGTSVRVPLILNPKQGTGSLAEAGTLNIARNIRTTHANITMHQMAHAVQVTRRLKRMSGNPATSWAQALKLEMKLAEEAMPRVANEMLNGNGDALLGTVTDTANSTSLTVTGGNAFQLYEGRVVDVLVRADGTVVSAGRQIVSYTESTGVIVLDSAVNHTSAHGVYIEGSYGNACQGIQQAGATTGIFESVDRASYAGWKGVDGRNGDTSAADLSIVILDGAIRRRGRNGLDGGGFWLGDPAVIDKFGQTLLAQARWDGSYSQLKTGWKGIAYNEDILIKEYDHPSGQITYVPTDDCTFYSTQPGPDWDDETGSMFQRFSRSLPVEAWLVDEFQFGVHRCNRFTKVANLNQAA
jgi:hypothetical protein